MKVYISTAASDIPECIKNAIDGNVPRDVKKQDAMILEISNQTDYGSSRMMGMSKRQKFANFLDDYVRDRIQTTTGEELPDMEDVEDEGEIIDLCADYMKKARMKFTRRNCETLAEMLMDYAP